MFYCIKTSERHITPPDIMIHHMFSDTTCFQTPDDLFTRCSIITRCFIFLKHLADVLKFKKSGKQPQNVSKTFYFLKHLSDVLTTLNRLEDYLKHLEDHFKRSGELRVFS